LNQRFISIEWVKDLFQIFCLARRLKLKREAEIESSGRLKLISHLTSLSIKLLSLPSLPFSFYNSDKREIQREREREKERENPR
jgi:hypothetical protein